ncbi:hypothetical protein SLEP1_g4084 [Rubroshorea leprosula]|uniref:Uncharacterized protein n=1 Tax=Rubroshorea leprosula TaxID=152421 RepID=A0AAV5HVQ7_9ROSI|nr:hypothetical protein SLEP1_g4084 [Rubroshorea leprosula]
MDLLRLESMQLAQLIIQMKAAHRTISYLGDLGLFQFKGFNAEKSPFQRTYAAPGANDQGWLVTASMVAWFFRSGGIDLDSLEVYYMLVKLGELESELVEMNANCEKLQQSYCKLLEYKLVLQMASEIFHSAQSSAAAQQKATDAQYSGGGSIDSPLLLEQ